MQHHRGFCSFRGAGAGCDTVYNAGGEFPPFAPLVPPGPVAGKVCTARHVARPWGIGGFPYAVTELLSATVRGRVNSPAFHIARIAQ